MAMEDVLDTYVARRRQRADWVQQQNRAVVETLLQEPAILNAALRERGDQGMHDRFEPLVPGAIAHVVSLRRTV